MRSMTIYQFGDVLYAQFPFSDLSDFKTRPSVVVSHSEYQRTKGDVLIAAITSRLHVHVSLREFVLDDYVFAGLPKPSAVKSNLFTLHENRIMERIGSLSQTDCASLKKMLQFNLPVNEQ